jgi:hypothetical protein
MALAIIDGNDTAFDVTFGIGASGAAVSFKCFATRVDVRTSRNNPVRPPTFCSSGWTSRAAGQKTTHIHLSGLGSTGSLGSDPHALFASATPIAFIVTATTGCTWTGTCLGADDGSSIEAAGNHTRDIDADSSGSVATLWTTA